METTAFKELSSKLILIHEDLREMINISKTQKIDETKIIETLKRELKISFNIVDEQQAVNSQELLINSTQDIYNDNEENEEEENKPLVRNKSDWIPRPTKDKDLEETIKTLKTNSLTSNKNVKYNLTREEKTALQNLKSDKSIIIKEANKGNAVVIMDREYYRDSILNILQDEMSYEVTHKKLDRQTSTMIKKLLKKHETELFKEG
ncbi:uncharacterized protein LOC134689974 [Mytilus trossulus]|uniref:uncharacterized protein LOC134689974 n=1 Tax=Mytilus trossulus TaxID=6551 RepID=UPI0030067083